MKKKIKNQISYSSSFKFLKESKKYIFSIIIIFIISIFMGYFFSNIFQEQIIKMLSNLANLFKGLSLIETIILIIGNNLQAALISILFGILFGILPIFTAIINGYIIGFIIKSIVPEFGAIIFWRLLPHGVFELPAIFISIGLGLKLGFEIFNKKKNNKRNLLESLKVFILIVLPLLLIAGIIEGILIFYFS